MSGHTCHEEIADPVTGGAEPCGIKAVGWRIDPEENQPYPVCTLHHRWPYADEWVALAAAVERIRMLCDDARRSSGGPYVATVDVLSIERALDAPPPT